MAIQEDPYRPPVAHVADVRAAGEGFIDGGRAVAVRRGWEWVGAGWRIFRRQWRIWLLLTLVLFLVLLIVGIVPILGTIALPIIVPILAGGLMLACGKVDRGEEIELADLFSGFQRNTGTLVVIGLISLGLMFLVSVAAVALTALLGFGMPAIGATMDYTAPAVVLLFLVYLALTLPVYMALWFAPALVVLQNLGAGQALAQSFRGGLKNIVPFLVYGILLFPLSIVAAIPAFLGWLVLAPVVIGSVYQGYRDVYLER